MRKLNRVIAAGALAVPMALGASGIAVAAEGSSGVQNQVGAAEGNGSGSEEDILDLGHRDGDSGNRDGDSGNEDNFLEELLRALLGEDDDEGNSGNDSILGGGNDDEGNSGNDSILGGGNDDEGNSGNDSILGGGNDDEGNSGNDSILGGGNDDEGNSGNDSSSLLGIG